MPVASRSLRGAEVIQTMTSLAAIPHGHALIYLRDENRVENIFRNYWIYGLIHSTFLDKSAVQRHDFFLKAITKY